MVRWRRSVSASFVGFLCARRTHQYRHGRTSHKTMLSRLTGKAPGFMKARTHPARLRSGCRRMGLSAVGVSAARVGLAVAEDGTKGSELLSGRCRCPPPRCVLCGLNVLVGCRLWTVVCRAGCLGR
ncbi:hypothetical protein EV126DRAFT_421985 [Verticillium dahliae]|nr:hypothetical protein EV126DRAFT_421985 [Verticillium dahliae]